MLPDLNAYSMFEVLFMVNINLKEVITMKKMSKKSMMHAEGGKTYTIWCTYVYPDGDPCDWSVSAPAFSSVLEIMAGSHVTIYPQHYGYTRYSW